MINSYDIVGIQESKSDDCDESEVPGFQIVYNNRQKLSSRKSGGIVLLIKDEIFEFIQTDTKQQPKRVQWFSISNLISPMNERITMALYTYHHKGQDMQMKIHTLNFNKRY